MIIEDQDGAPISQALQDVIVEMDCDEQPCPDCKGIREVMGDE
jgi:hypothetical protein